MKTHLNWNRCWLFQPSQAIQKETNISWLISFLWYLLTYSRISQKDGAGCKRTRCTLVDKLLSAWVCSTSTTVSNVPTRDSITLKARRRRSLVLTKVALKLQRLSLPKFDSIVKMIRVCQGILEHILMKSLFPWPPQGPWGIELFKGKATSSQGKCIQVKCGHGFTSFLHATHCGWTWML